MDTPPTAKRRRLNDALHKPFKSPLRPPLKPNANPSVASPLGHTPMNRSDDAGKTSENASNISVEAPTPVKRQSASLLKVAITPSKPAPSSPADTGTLQEIQVTSREIRRLESAAIKQRQDLDTLRQALSIVESTKSIELDNLTQKWRQAARLAAEEVFAGARDKVNRMGGVGAWRERENERKNFGNAWDKEEEVKNTDKDSDDEDQGGEEKEGTEYERDERIPTVEDDWEYDRGRLDEEKEKEVGVDDDSFTMDMMLKTMNIDLDLLGYDKHRQTWVG